MNLLNLFEKRKTYSQHVEQSGPSQSNNEVIIHEGPPIDSTTYNDEAQKEKVVHIKKHPKKATESNAISDFLQSIILALVICVFVYVVIAMPNQIEGDSMKPN